MGKEGSLYSQSWSVESDENTRASQGGAAQTNGATDGRRRSELLLPCVSVRRAGAKEARIVQREMVLRCAEPTSRLGTAKMMRRRQGASAKDHVGVVQYWLFRGFNSQRSRSPLAVSPHVSRLKSALEKSGRVITWCTTTNNNRHPGRVVYYPSQERLDMIRRCHQSTNTD